MARDRSPRGKKIRREGEDLGLISARRGFETKCRKNTPGQHGAAPGGKMSEYGLQLRAKQKLRRIYGILERQFRKYFEIANSKRGGTGDNLLTILESRLDNVVFRMGFASTRAEARQLVSHKAVSVNGDVVNIPSYGVKAGDVIAIRERAKQQVRIVEALSLASTNGFPDWCDINPNVMEGTFKRIPNRDELYTTVTEQLQLVVEFYSK